MGEVKNTQLLYLATNLFTKGGIQRYSRAQVMLLREMLGEENVVTLSLHPPGDNQFEESFKVDYVGQGLSVISKLRYIIRAVRYGLCQRPGIIWTNHVALSPVANAIRYLVGAAHTVVNVYGLEMWSGLPSYKRRALRNATHVVSDSHFTANYVQRAFDIPEKRISIVWVPVDVGKFAPRDTASKILPRYGVPYRSDACYLMTLGRISVTSRHKGYDRLLDVMGQIERDDIIYLVAGDGDDRARLEKRVADEGLEKRVFFLGLIPEDELVDIYNAADVFVLVSDWGYGRGEGGGPLSTLEAAACGKPIIVGNEDSSPEAVVDGENGYIVSPHNLNAIQRSISRLADDPKLRKKMGRAARLRVEQDFSYQKFRTRTKAVLKHILSKGEL